MTEPVTGKRQTADLRVIGILAVMALPFLCALSAAVGLLDPNVRRGMAFVAQLIPYIATAVSIAFSLTIIVAVLYAAGLAATDVIRRWHLRHVIFPTMTGMFPLVRGDHNWFDATPDGVKAIAAWTHAQAANGVKPQSKPTQAAISAALYGQPFPPPAPPPALPERTTFDVRPAAFNLGDIDPLTRPHWLLVGQTGSGKSTAVRTIANELARRYPTEFVICEPGGVDWNSQANAYSDHGIAQAVAAVYAEFERRQEALRHADASHITALPQIPPYLYLIIEELEAVLDNLKDLDRDAAITMRVQLRNLARMGRKEGVGLIAVTQVAKADVFDTHVRSNLANVFLFRNAQGVAEMFRLGRQVDLPSLPAGVAYSMAHEQLVQFQPVPRPVLPLSPVYHEDGTKSELVLPVVYTKTTRSGDPEPVLRLDPGRLPTPAEAQHMRALKERGWSQNRIIWQTYGYKNGIVNDYVRDALEGRL